MADETTSPPPAPQGAPTEKGRNWTRWLLFASLAANVLVIGLVAGVALRDPGSARLAPLPPPGLRDLIAAMPEQSREQMRAQLGGALQSAAPSRQEQIRLSIRFRRALLSDPLDRATLEEIFAIRSATTATLGSAAQSAFLDALEDLSREDRAALAAALAERRPRGERHPDLDHRREDGRDRSSD